MSSMLINILIRTSKRPTLYKRCIESIKAQPCQPVNIHVCVDDKAAYEYVYGYSFLYYTKKESQPFGYNLYCNYLKEQVTEGFFMFLDDDDYLLPGSLHQITQHLEYPGIICQMLRNNYKKPSDSKIRKKVIQKGYIGMPCIILHHSCKHLSTFQATEDADYLFIKEVSEKVNLKFVPIPVVATEQRSKGAMETSYFQ